jgi:N,N'-diacetyllegionaminate synthase
MKIDNFLISNKSKPFIIAEVAQAHDGSLGQAFAFIDAVSSAGADAIKFQTHLAEYESSRFDKFRPGTFFPQDKTRFDYWKRMEFSPSEWSKLKKYANKRGLSFLSSPFSIEAVDMLEEIKVPAWKIGSGEFFNTLLIERILKTKKPLLISTGLSSLNEIKKLSKTLDAKKAKYAFFQCNSEYPCPPERVGLNVIKELKSALSCPIGFSDHSGELASSLAAVTMGASIIEVHVSLSEFGFGPDHTSSLTIDKLEALVKGTQFIHTALSKPVNKNKPSEKILATKRLFTRSIFASEDILPGTKLTEQNIRFKKPAGGLSSEDLSKLLGKKITKKVKCNEMLSMEHFK